MLICKAPTGQYADRLVPTYGPGATSRLLKISKEPASATEAGSSFHSFTVQNTNWFQIEEAEFYAPSCTYLLCFPGREFGTRSIASGGIASKPLRIL